MHGGGRLEGKPRTPLSSRVATRVSWSPLSGLKGVQPPHSSLLHTVPVPLPVFHTPPLWPMDADPWVPTSLNQPLLPWDQKPGAVGTLKSSCGQRRPGSRVQGALLSGSSTGETRPIGEASPSEPALLAVPPPALHPTPGGTQTRPQAPDPHRQQASRSPKPLGCRRPLSVQGVGACGRCSSRSPVVQWASVHPPVATRPAPGRPGPPRCP